MVSRREYYQGLADLIRIVWEGHKQSIALGEIPFGVHHEKGTRQLAPYSFERSLAEHEAEFGMAYNPALDFGNAIGHAVQVQWLALRDARMGAEGFPALQHIKTFNTPYVNNLIAKLEEQAPTGSGAKGAESDKGERIVYRSVAGGASTQGSYAAYTLTSAELATSGVLPRQAALAFAKVNLDHFDKLSELLCVDEYHKNREQVSKVITTEGLEKEKLRELGFSTAVGCPARMPATQDCWEYLRSHGVEKSRQVVIDEFMCEAEKYFLQEVVPHLRAHESKLTREFLYDMRMVAKKRGCPYHG
jgi:hypothetical protein